MRTILGPGKRLTPLLILGVLIISLIGYVVGARIALVNNPTVELTNPEVEGRTQTKAGPTPTVIQLDTGDFSEEAPEFGPSSNQPQNN